MKKINYNLCIYVDNFTDWIDIQKILLNSGTIWSGTTGKGLFKKFTNFNSDEIIFPRILYIKYNIHHEDWVMLNVCNNERCMENYENYKEIQGKSFIRKFKLENLKT